MRAALPLLGAVLALAACGDIPQPFRHDDSGVPRLAVPKLTRGVTVHPAADSADGRALAEALVRALEDQEVPALVSDGPAFGYVLDGTLEETAQGVRVVWTLKAPDGSETAAARHEVTGTTLRQGNPVLMKRAAMAAATQLAQALADPDATAGQTPAVATDTRPTATVAALHGLPGDGDQALTEAMKRALGRGGLAIKPEGGSYRVEGTVTVAPGRPGEDLVGVAWVVRRGKDGAELGRVAQDGSVPRGRLAQGWGTMARDIAEGAAAGVVEVVLADSETARRATP